MKVVSIIALAVLAAMGIYEIVDGMAITSASATVFQQIAGMMKFGFGTLTLAVIFGAGAVAAKTVT
jgi:hypothetical protein